MRRFRSIVVLVSLLLALPCYYVVHSASESIEQAEYDAFRGVASVCFDRIEEELLAILEREDQRDVSDYDTPSVEPPPQGEIVGWFQIDPEGEFQTPHPQGEGIAPDDAERLELLQAAHDYYVDNWLTSRLVLPELRPFLRDVPVARVPEPLPARAGKGSAPRYSGKGGSSASDAEKTSAFSGKGGSPPQVELHLPTPAPTGRSPAVPLPTVTEPPVDRAASHAGAREHRELAAGGVRIEIDPVQVVPMSADLLLGVRRAWIDGRQYRQVFALRPQPLMRRLAGMASRTLPAGMDARFRIRYDHHGPVAESWTLGSLRARSSFYSVHACARPFDCFLIRLDSSAVDGGFSGTTLWLVVGTLLGIAVLGIIAIDRALASLVESAKRRQGFVSSVTHELKTPLTTIRMYGEMLRDGVVTDQERQREYHAAIASEGERLSRLVDNVLDLAKLERGRYRFRVEQGDVGEVLTSVAETMRVYATSLGFELRIELEGELPAARFDRDALIQVLINLVDNALKFSRDHEPKVVMLGASGRNGSVFVTVTDHGPGIPQRELGRVVRPFYRADDGLTRDTRGTGLGLGLVRLLAHGMHGELTLVNHSDGGLMATVQLVAASGPVR